MKITLNALKIAAALLLICMYLGCSSSNSEISNSKNNNMKQLTAKDILGNNDYPAISYGGYRTSTRDKQPSIDELKEDMLILHAMGIRILRTYNVHFDQAANLLAAIKQLRQEDSEFEMYVMLGTWIRCKDADTANPDHEGEDLEKNEEEIEIAVELVKQYPEIVKILAVGNEAMVKWAASYFVQPRVILKYVKQLQDLKRAGELPADLWITSSDNFASWGGGGGEYHVDDLTELIKAVDYISLHTYPMHDTHYNADFWGISEDDTGKSKEVQIQNAMIAAGDYAVKQFNAVAAYVKSLGIDKPLHIGETGWATYSNALFGIEGSKACDEFKEALYYKYIRKWSEDNAVSVFYFEAFDEIWKDAGNPGGSENYFGLFTIEGMAKYALWEKVDDGVFEGLTRNGNPIVKTFMGDKQKLLESVNMPPTLVKN